MSMMMSFAGKWMELEVIMLSEIGQVQKDKYCIFCSHAESRPKIIIIIIIIIILHDCNRTRRREKKAEGDWG
jgi:hypothetical protein